MSRLWLLVVGLAASLGAVVTAFVGRRRPSELEKTAVDLAKKDAARSTSDAEQRAEMEVKDYDKEAAERAFRETNTRALADYLRQLDRGGR